MTLRRVFRPLLRRVLRRLLRADALYKQVRVTGSLRTLTRHTIARRSGRARVRSTQRYAARRMMAAAFRCLYRARVLTDRADRRMQAAEDHCTVRRLGRTMEALRMNRDEQLGRTAAAKAAASACWQALCWKKFLRMVMRRAGRRRATHAKQRGGRPSTSRSNQQRSNSHPHVPDTVRRATRSWNGNGDAVRVRVPPPFPRLNNVVGALTIMRRAMRTWTALLHGMQVRATARAHWRNKSMRNSLSCWRVRVRCRLHQRNKVTADLTCRTLRAWYSRTQRMIQRSTTISTILSEISLRKRKKKIRNAFLRLVRVALTLSVSRALRAALAAGWTRWLQKSRLSFNARPNRRQVINRSQVRLATLSRAWATLQQWLSSKRKIRRRRAVAMAMAMDRKAKAPLGLGLDRSTYPVLGLGLDGLGLVVSEKAFNRWRTYCRGRTTRRQIARHCAYVLRRRFLLLGAMRALSLRGVGPGSLRNALLQKQQQQRRLQMRKTLQTLCGFAAGRWAKRQEARLLLIEQQRKRLGLGWAALRTMVRHRRDDTRPSTSQSRC